MEGFDKLDIDSKSLLLHYRGRILTSIGYYNYKVTLHIFQGELVEEYFDTETREISRICNAKDHDLKKYLDQIDISDLLAAY